MTLAAVSLNRLFTTCIDCFDRVQLREPKSRDLQILHQRLDNQKARFMIWGESLYLNDTTRRPLLGLLGFACQSAAETMTLIASLFQNSDELVNCYGLTANWVDLSRVQESNSTDNLPNRHSLHAQPNPLRQVFSRFSSRLKTWVITDPELFLGLIKALRRLIDVLESLNESSEVIERRQRIVTVDVEMISEEDLRLIQEAGDFDKNIWSDTASARLKVLSERRLNSTLEDGESSIQQSCKPASEHVNSTASAQGTSSTTGQPTQLTPEQGTPLTPTSETSCTPDQQTESGTRETINTNESPEDRSQPSLSLVTDRLTHLQHNHQQKQENETALTLAIHNTGDGPERGFQSNTMSTTALKRTDAPRTNSLQLAFYNFLEQNLIFRELWNGGLETLAKSCRPRLQSDDDLQSKVFPHKGKRMIFEDQRQHLPEVRLSNENKWVDWYQLSDIGVDYNVCLAVMAGPPETPYEGGVFFLEVQLPKDYPFHPPTVRFLTKIYHPAVNAQGVIGVDILHSQWSTVLTITTILISICSLLDEPNLDDPLVPEIAEIYRHDRDIYDLTARIYTERYAQSRVPPAGVYIVPPSS